MKRRLTKLVVFLLLGAVVNVAVAWGSSVLIGFTEITSDIRAYRSSTVGTWNVETYHRFSAFRVELLRAGESTPNYLEGPLPKNLVPTWIGYDPELYENRRVELWVAEARGWPLLVLWSKRMTWFQDLDGTDHDVFAEGAIELPLSPFSGTRGPMTKALPLRPIWPGFAINTIFYAAILWLLTLGPYTARRVIRHKRGHCIKCGYDLRGDSSAGCPECGWRREDVP